MSALDPALGTHNLWCGDAIARGTVPTLYQSEGSYHSQVARLGLTEKGAKWKSRLMDLHSAELEQARAARGAAGDASPRKGAKRVFGAPSASRAPPAAAPARASRCATRRCRIAAIPTAMWAPNRPSRPLQPQF